MEITGQVGKKRWPSLRPVSQRLASLRPASLSPLSLWPANRWPRALLGRLIIVVLVIDGIAAALCGLVIMVQARSATAIETTAAMHVAELLVTDTIGLMKEAPAPLLLQTIALQSATVRHVRATVTDADGQPVQAGNSGSTARTAFESHAPDLFERIVAPVPTVKVVPVLLRNRLVGNVTLTSEPSDEIDEAWHYAHALLIAGVCLSLAVLTALILVFSRVLAPLTRLASGLKGLESHDYAIRLERPKLREFAVIADHFNRTARALQAANKANNVLNRKLLTAQDDERRRTALELHDEVGPCLFALDVEASSIVTLTKDLPDNARVHSGAKEVVAMVKQVQGINRRLLDRLRPMSLGRIPLTENLYKVLVDFEGEQYPVITHEIGPLADRYGQLVDLTIYRCAQEGLFNAVRHAQASRIVLTVREVEDASGDRRIEMSIRDDGRGVQPSSRPGIGISGMRERVEALSGTFTLTSSAEGTTLQIIIPLATEEAAVMEEAMVR